VLGAWIYAPTYRTGTTNRDVSALAQSDGNRHGGGDFSDDFSDDFFN
jgi:hypothetical protein